jgi:Family of unknown function (DUF5309)
MSIQNAPIQGLAVPQVQGELSVWKGLATTGAVPERLLVRGMDDLGTMAFITRNYTKFLSMLHTRYPKSKTKETREHRTFQMDELDRVLDITVPTTAADNHTSFGIPNSHAAQMQENDVVYTKGLYAMVDTDLQPYWSTTFGESGGRIYTNYEPLLVTAVENNDSAGIGNTRVYVRRLFTARGAGDFQGGVITPPAVLPLSAALNTTYKLLRGLPSFPEGGDAPLGFYKNPVVDNNFTQEFKYAVEITKEQEIEKTYIGKTPIEIYKMLKMRQANLDIERTFLFGRKGKTMDSQGRVQYTMGGVLEYIPQDTDHVIKYDQPTINYNGLLDLVDKIMRNGGSSEKDFFCGITLYTEMKKAFYSSGYLRYDEEASANFDIPIESIVGAGGKLNIIPLYTLEEAGWGNKGLVMDFSVPSFVPVTHSGWDMKVEKDIQLPGQQIYKEQWIGIKGLERRYAQYQHIVYFPNL